MSSQDQDIKVLPQQQRLEDDEAGFRAALQELEDFVEIPITVNVIVGKKMVKLRDLLNFSPGSLVVLDRSASESFLIFLGDTFFARGEVTIIEDSFGVRITEINDPRKI
jgi:flagellar motor switch protein FliN/FliY